MRGFTVVRLALAVASGACFAACRAGEPAAVAAQAERAPIAVSVAPVAGEDVPVIIDVTGSFAAAESSDVAPEVSGLVVATPVDVGSLTNASFAIRRSRASISSGAIRSPDSPAHW